MDSSAMALTGILILVILILPLGPSWFMVFPVLIGMIAFSWHRRRRRRSTEDQGLLLHNSPPAGDDQPPAGDASLPADDEAPPADDDQPPAGDASLPADDEAPPAGDASLPADDEAPPADDEAPPARDGQPPAGDDQPSALASDPASGASPPPGPLPAGSAPPPAVDALVPSGKKRSEPESSSTPSSPSGFEHELFLNCGELEIDSPFMADLNCALENARIRVVTGDDVKREIYSDEEFMRPLERDFMSHRKWWQRGEQKPRELIMQEQSELFRQKQRELIQRSRISIAIFSEYFATRERCLKELVQMWEGRESNGQIIIPIFYDVSPSDVIHQAGDFGRSFNVHEKSKVNSDTIEKWREVLRQIGRLRGFIRENVNGDDSQLVKIVVKSVGQVLRKDDQVVTDRLVGIDHHVQEMMKKLGVAYREGQAVEVRGEEVRVVVIGGAPGVGKTTLAKVVFNNMRKLFDAYSFLEDIRSEGVQFSRHMLIADLQKQKPKPLESSREEIASLCRNVRVLIVLDNVDEDEQIKELVGKFTWFGPGSRIIVTTNKALGGAAFDRGIVEPHMVGPMSEKNALDLFHEHAFQGATAEDVSKYDSLSRDIVKAIGGLPSEIVRYASYLRDHMNMDTWKTTLDLLRDKPKK